MAEVVWFSDGWLPQVDRAGQERLRRFFRRSPDFNSKSDATLEPASELRHVLRQDAIAHAAERWLKYRLPLS
jgi:hypothetical protein